ncbi:glucose 1-dehydrogenase [soil metagenome]
MRGLAGRVIVVTGAASGIGAAGARRLAAEGATVVIGDVALDRAREVAADIAATGATASARELDVADEAQWRDLVAAVVADHGGLDGVYHNAAAVGADTLGFDTDIVAGDVDTWRRTLDVNLTGTYLGCRHAVPALLERGGGAIVCTSSDAAFLGEPQRPAYAASKAGVGALVRHVAARWGPEGIRANAIAPGLVLTETVEAHLPDRARTAIERATPSPRLGHPDDIAAMAAYLLSDDATWINGQTYSVNGGVTFR